MIKKVGFLLIVLSVGLNIYLILRPGQAPEASKMQLAGQTSYHLLSPRIFAENQNDLIINFIPLRERLHQLSAQLTSGKIGIYFEYLPTGTSIGLNEKESFVPASLLKTPLAMGVYRHIEQGTLEPHDTVTMKESLKDDGFGVLWKLQPGATLTIQQALDYLIRESDNTAQKLLLTKITIEEVDQVFDALDIPKIRDSNGAAVVTAKNYSSILRCLYLSCYLSKNSSNKLLEQLTQTRFTDKLTAPIPTNILVAHKIGEHIVPTDPTKNVYTDCGIIYYPKRPYILCVMIESNEETARQVIRQYSQIVYDYVSTYR